MKSRIYIKKIWFDDDDIELKIEVSDGNSLFSNCVYINHQQIENLIKGLNEFRVHLYDNLYDIKFGEFGPEFANGGFRARLNFQTPGKLYISTYQQSDFEEFSKELVANEAKLHLTTEPILLDNFITELTGLNTGKREDASLECI
ncbi:MAG: hypothetical protein ACU85E_01025 [Gammaproteobacteria bacterium]